MELPSHMDQQPSAADQSSSSPGEELVGVKQDQVPNRDPSSSAQPTHTNCRGRRRTAGLDARSSPTPLKTRQLRTRSAAIMTDSKPFESSNKSDGSTNVGTPEVNTSSFSGQEDPLLAENFSSVEDENSHFTPEFGTGNTLDVDYQSESELSEGDEGSSDYYEEKSNKRPSAKRGKMARKKRRVMDSRR